MITSGTTVSDKEWNVSGGINTIEEGATAEVLVMASKGFSFDGTTAPSVTINSSNGTAGRLLLKNDIIVQSTLTGSAQILSGGSLANPGYIEITTLGSPVFRINDAAPTQDLIVSAAIIGAALDKQGTGRLVLSGTNSYAATSVTAGSLQVGNAGVGTTGTGAVTVSIGATLLGTGTIKGSAFTANSGATIHAGDDTTSSSHGTLNFTPASSATYTFSSGSSTVLDITTPNATDPTYGGNAIGSSGYNSYVDSFSGVGSGSHDLLNFGSNANATFSGNIQVVGSGSFTPKAGQIFNLLDWVSANFSGFSIGTNLRNGSGDNTSQFDLPDISASGLVWDVSRFTTSGVVVVVPEPSRVLLAAIGLTSIALRRRRQSC